MQDAGPRLSGLVLVDGENHQIERIRQALGKANAKAVRALNLSDRASGSLTL
jgi:hypothetical protein